MEEIPRVLYEMSTKAALHESVAPQTQKQIIAGCALLRAHNRQQYQLTKATKDQTTELKLELDTIHLQLQSLLYQQRHLSHEIQVAKNAQTIYETVPLMSETEYLERVPENRSLSPHELMLARLHDEKEERQRLEAIRKDLAAKKASLISDNRQREQKTTEIRAELERLQTHLKRISTL